MFSVMSEVFASFSKFHRSFSWNQAKCFFAPEDLGSRARRRVSPLLAMVLVFAAVATLSTPAFAQVIFGTVVGTVVDSSGAVVSGATVKLTNLGTNETRSVQTGSSGIYTFPNLIAGLYRVDVEVAGFKHFTQDKVEVQVDVTTRVEAALQVGKVTEIVEVTSEAPPLQADSASLGTVISQQEVETIPLSGRNVNNMLTLVPGVVAQGGTYGNAVSNQASGARTNAIGFGNYAIGGGFGNQSSFYIDGVPSNSPAGNVNAIIPSQDAVQEFRVVTNNVAAEYGNYAGGVVNLTTKSGTNAFHGTVYEYLRNKVLNANDFFSNKNKITRAPLIQNQFGGTIGGPVVKNKTFFFGGYEREVLHTSTLVTNNTLPTATELAGDFTGFPAIYDRSKPGNPQFSCNGVLNVICPNDPRLATASSLSAVALIRASYPILPAGSPTARNFNTSMATGGINEQYNARVDHHFSDMNSLFARYTYWKVDSNAYDAWGTHTSGQGHTGIYTQQAVLADTHAFNPTTILDVRLSYLRVFQHEFPDSSNVDLTPFGPNWAALKPQLAASPNLPALAFGDAGGVTSLSGSNGIGSQLFWHQNTYTLLGNITKIAGRHQVKVGGMVRRVQWISTPENGPVTLNFDQNATAQAAGVGGYSLASALLGIPASTSYVYIGGSRAYFTAYGFFVDDTFQATKRLTITAGLRWDQPSTYSEASNNDTVFLPNAVSPLNASFPGGFVNPVTGQPQTLMGNAVAVGTPAWPSGREDNLHWKMFSPRLGFAYRATERTVVRAAYGISYPPTTLSQDGPNIGPVNGAPTNYTNSFSTAGGNSNDVITATADNPLPQPTGIVLPPRHNATPGFFYGQSYFIMRVPGDRSQYVQQYNVAVERQVGKDASLTLAYAGSHGSNLLMQGLFTVSDLGLNQLPDRYLFGGSQAMTVGQLQATVANPFFGKITTPGSWSAATIAVGQLLRPFPQYDRVLALDPHRGKSDYRSVQATFMKRFGGGGVLSVAYTWSRLLSNTDSSSAFLDESGPFSGALQNNNDLASEYSRSTYDIPQNLAIGYGVGLPFGRGKRFLGESQGVANAIVGGWKVSGITTLRSGNPFSASQFTFGSAQSQFGMGPAAFGFSGNFMRTDFLPSCNTSVLGSRESRATNGWFNTACFQAVDVYNPALAPRFGNEPRTVPSIRLDAVNNWDFSITKRNQITESVYLQFTTEFFNLFNRPRFGSPGVTLGPTFGIVTNQSNPPRQIQFGLRIGF